MRMTDILASIANNNAFITDNAGIGPKDPTKKVLLGNKICYNKSVSKKTQKLTERRQASVDIESIGCMLRVFTNQTEPFSFGTEYYSKRRGYGK